MIDVCVTVDAESSKGVRDDGSVVHRDFSGDVGEPCIRLAELARRHDARFTFFYPLGELDPTTGSRLAARLAVDHELGVHRHLPSALWTLDRLGQCLVDEVAALTAATGRPPVSIRAGGYNTGSHETWISAVAAAGLSVDSSVWPGASTVASGEARAAARDLLAKWGEGSIAYDFRDAPLAGAYRTQETSLIRPGTGGPVEAPIAAAFHESSEPGPFRLDPQRMTSDLMIRTLEHLALWAGRRTVAVVMLHSGGLYRGSRASSAVRHLDRLLAWVRGTGGQVLTLSELAAADPLPGPVYGPDQPNRWPPVERSTLAELIRRCPRCTTALARTACPRCGWSFVHVRSQLIDARVERGAERAATATPTRAARKVRSALAISGGILGTAAGLTAWPAAAARVRRQRKDDVLR